MTPMDREAGLPRLTSDVDGPSTLTFLAKGTVKAVYPELWRVDIETADGGILHKAAVLSPHFPPVHKDLEQPSHVYFAHAYGHAEDVVCWPLTHRRFLDPERELKKEQGKNAHTQKDVGETSDAQGEDAEPERHFYHVHLYCQRAGDITLRVTDDHRWIIESEAGDMIRYSQKLREVDILAPMIRAGSMEHTRVEYERGEHVHVVMPEILLGTPQSDQRLVLGDLWRAFYNVFVTLFNGHRHLNVQPGGGLSGIPVQPTKEMPEDLLSDISKTQKSFPFEEYD